MLADLRCACRCLCRRPAYTLAGTAALGLAVGVALAGLLLVRAAQGERIDAQGKETGEQIGQLRERMARLDGLLEGLREAVTGKRAA